MALRRHIRKQTQKTRQTLISAALELSAENGFASLSLRSVARKAGIAPTSFYRHFRDMAELGVELVDEVELVIDEYLYNININLEEILARSTKDSLSDYQQAVKVFIEYFLNCVENNLHLFHFFFQVRVGSFAELRNVVNRVLEKLTHNYTIILIQLTKDEHAGKVIELISDTIVELMIKSGLEVLDQNNEKSNTVERVLEKTRLLFLGALSTQAQ